MSTSIPSRALLVSAKITQGWAQASPPREHVQNKRHPKKLSRIKTLNKKIGCAGGLGSALSWSALTHPRTDATAESPADERADEIHKNQSASEESMKKTTRRWDFCARWEGGSLTSSRDVIDGHRIQRRVSMCGGCERLGADRWSMRVRIDERD